MFLFCFAGATPVRHVAKRTVCLSRRNVEVDWEIGVWVPGWNLEISGAV